MLAGVGIIDHGRQSAGQVRIVIKLIVRREALPFGALDPLEEFSNPGVSERPTERPPTGVQVQEHEQLAERDESKRYLAANAPTRVYIDDPLQAYEVLLRRIIFLPARKRDGEVREQPFLEREIGRDVLSRRAECVTERVRPGIGLATIELHGKKNEGGEHRLAGVFAFEPLEKAEREVQHVGPGLLDREPCSPG